MRQTIPLTAVLLALALTSHSAANAHPYMVFFCIEDTMYRMSMSTPLQEPERWYHCDSRIYSIFQNQTGSKIYVVPLKYSEMKGEGLTGATLVQIDSQDKNNSKDVIIPTLREINDGVGTSLDDTIMVLRGSPLGSDPQCLFCVVLQVVDWHILHSEATYDVWWPKGDRLFYLPRSNTSIESCRLDGADVRSEWNFSLLSKPAECKDVVPYGASLHLIYQVGPLVEVYHALSGRSESSPTPLMKAEGRYLGSTDDKIFLRDPKNRLCVAPMHDNAKVTILSTLNDADEKLFSVYENNMMDADGNIFGNPHVGGMDEISRVYPTPDGAELLFLNDQGERYPLEVRVFDVKARMWSNRITMETGGTEAGEKRVLVLKASAVQKK